MRWVSSRTRTRFRPLVALLGPLPIDNPTMPPARGPIPITPVPGKASDEQSPHSLLPRASRSSPAACATGGEGCFLYTAFYGGKRPPQGRTSPKPKADLAIGLWAYPWSRRTPSGLRLWLHARSMLKMPTLKEMSRQLWGCGLRPHPHSCLFLSLRWPFSAAC